MAFVDYREVAPADLQSFPGNPTIHDEEELDASVERFGQFRTLVTRIRADGSLQLLAGHGTLEALLRSGVESVRVEVLDVDDDTARGIVLADNGTTRRRDYQPAELLALIAAARAAPSGLTGTGWDDAEHERLKALLAAPPPAADPPPEFPSYDEDIATEYCCPSCGYEWSGRPRGEQPRDE